MSRLDRQILFREGETEVQVTPETFVVIDHSEPQSITYVRWGEDGNRLLMVYESLTGNNDLTIEPTQYVLNTLDKRMPKKFIRDAFLHWFGGQ